MPPAPVTLPACNPSPGSSAGTELGKHGHKSAKTHPEGQRRLRRPGTVQPRALMLQLLHEPEPSLSLHVPFPLGLPAALV